MIYIEKYIGKQFISKLLTFGLSLKGQTIVLWDWNDPLMECPKYLRNEIESFSGGRRKMEPISIYEGQTWLKEAAIYCLNKDMIKILTNRCKELNHCLIGVAVYREKATKWFLSMFFREKITLLRVSDDDLLKNMGLPYSRTPPVWW